MKNKNTIIGIVVLLAIAFAIWWFATRRRVKGGTTVGYQFFRQTDSPGGDIKHIPGLVGNIPGLTSACKEIPECIAFNTSGYLKSSVDPNNFKQYSGYPDWAGLYVKRKALR